MENNWLNLMNLLKAILVSLEIVHHFKNKRNIINGFANLKVKEKRTNPDNLIDKYRTEGRSPKEFINY